MLRRRFLLGAGAAALLAVSVAFVSGLNTPLPGESLTPDEAYDLASRGDLILVDIRRPDEWARTGSAGAGQRLDMRREDFTDVLLEITDGDRAMPVGLICARGVRSARLARRLTEAGFSEIIDIPEGMLGSRAGPGWLARGLPVDESEA